MVVLELRVWPGRGEPEQEGCVTKHNHGFETTSGADPEHFDADPDPPFHVDADPDPDPVPDPKCLS